MAYGDASYASVPYAAGADFGTFSQALYRSLELVANRGANLPAITYRALALVENKGPLLLLSCRVLTLLDARGIQALVAGLYRTLSNLESYTNDPMFPWLFSIAPTQQYRGGQISLTGDGFGATQAALTSNVLLGAALEIMGVISWSTRSAGLWPANGVSPNVFSPAIVATVPSDAVSGLVEIKETTP